MDNPDKTYPEIGWFKEKFKVLQITEDVFEFECLMSGKGFVPPHLHKYCEEEFTAIDGTLIVKIGKKVQSLEPSNKIVAPQGEVHSLRNLSIDKIRFRVSMKPNKGMSSLFEIMIFLKEKYPEKKYSVVTAMYILKKLKLKEFSTPVGFNYFFESTAMGLAFVLAPFLGWPRLAGEFDIARQVN
jgi:mannose-6-phosphate isomerase-like protein (cupin superfamily)